MQSLSLMIIHKIHKEDFTQSSGSLCINTVVSIVLTGLHSRQWHITLQANMWLTKRKQEENNPLTLFTHS